MPWSLGICSTRNSKWECIASQSETLICTRRTKTHQFIWRQPQTCCALGRSPMEFRVVGQLYKLCTFTPDIGTHHFGITLLWTAWVVLNRLRNGVGRFRSCLHKWRNSYSAACECGVQEQTAEHVVLQLSNLFYHLNNSSMPHSGNAYKLSCTAVATEGVLL